MDVATNNLSFLFPKSIGGGGGLVNDFISGLWSMRRRAETFPAGGVGAAD